MLRILAVHSRFCEGVKRLGCVRAGLSNGMDFTKVVSDGSWDERRCIRNPHSAHPNDKKDPIARKPQP